MFKRKDNDIFGTAQLGYGTRINNPSSIDPNAAFQKRMEQNYNNYANKVISTPHSITGRPLDSSNVNERVNFEENYHKNRKDADLQSTIFYQPTPRVTTQAQVYEDESMSSSRYVDDGHFGRKQTFKREISQLPVNEIHRGNSSRLFDMQERCRPKTEENIPMAPLIPCQMQWDQHDSVKYAHINDLNKYMESKPTQNIQESQSTIFNQEDIDVKKLLRGNQPEDIPIKKADINALKKAKSQKDIKKVEPEKKGKEPVEIKVQKGWDYKYMEGLSKNCKLSGTAILKFQAEEGGKATLLIKRSDRWENVTDWLRREAKMRIRVMNN